MPNATNKTLAEVDAVDHHRRHSAPSRRRPSHWLGFIGAPLGDAMARMIERAKAARCSALVWTLDLQVIGQRHKGSEERLERAAPPHTGKLTEPGHEARLVCSHRADAALSWLTWRWALFRLS